MQPPNLTLSGTCEHLGITDLSWHPHITNVCCKRRKLIGLLYRRFYNHTTPAAMLKIKVTLDEY